MHSKFCAPDIPSQTPVRREITSAPAGSPSPRAQLFCQQFESETHSFGGPCMSRDNFQLGTVGTAFPRPGCEDRALGVGAEPC